MLTSCRRCRHLADSCAWGKSSPDTLVQSAQSQTAKNVFECASVGWMFSWPAVDHSKELLVSFVLGMVRHVFRISLRPISGYRLRFAARCFYFAMQHI